jgi:methionine salvage enolase-phosphatase E1
VPANEAVFLDDIGNNLKAARNLGIQTIKVAGGQPQGAILELQKLLKKELVTWPKGLFSTFIF